MVQLVIKRPSEAVIHIVGNDIDLSKMPLINNKHEEEKDRYNISFLFSDEAQIIVGKDGMNWLYQDPSNFVVVVYRRIDVAKVFGSWDDYGNN